MKKNRSVSLLLFDLKGINKCAAKAHVIPTLQVRDVEKTRHPGKSPSVHLLHYGPQSGCLRVLLQRTGPTLASLCRTQLIRDYDRIAMELINRL